MGVDDKKNKYLEAKQKRLAQEAKAKMYAREQYAKVKKARERKNKVDVKAAVEKGKYDEAFHKNAVKNKELMHKRGREKIAKKAAQAKERVKKANDMKEFDEHLAKESARKKKENAFKLVQKERKYKSGNVYDKVQKKYKGKFNVARKKLWDQEDAKRHALIKQKKMDIKIRIAKGERHIKVKIAKEKIGKKKAAASESKRKIAAKNAKSAKSAASAAKSAAKAAKAAKKKGKKREF